MCSKLPFSLPLKYRKSLIVTQNLPEKSKYQKLDSFPLSLQKSAEGLIRLNYHKTWNEEKTSGTLLPGWGVMIHMNPITKAHTQQTQHSPPISSHFITSESLAPDRKRNRNKCWWRDCQRKLVLPPFTLPLRIQRTLQTISLFCHHLVQNNFNFA